MSPDICTLSNFLAKILSKEIFLSFTIFTLARVRHLNSRLRLTPSTVFHFLTISSLIIISRTHCFFENINFNIQCNLVFIYLFFFKSQMYNV